MHTNRGPAPAEQQLKINGHCFLCILDLTGLYEKQNWHNGYASARAVSKHNITIYNTL